jgi:hypothetical protein
MITHIRDRVRFAVPDIEKGDNYPLRYCPHENIEGTNGIVGSQTFDAFIAETFPIKCFIADTEYNNNPQGEF